MPRMLEYGFAQGRFGRLLVACDTVGVCFAGYCDEEAAALADLRRRFADAELRPSKAFAGFDGGRATFHLIGTPFRLAVWRALREIPAGERIGYAALAARMGRPAAVRAVASAVARNPVAFYVPCHRVVRSDGNTGQYRWGAARKRRMLDAECREAISSR